MSNLPFKSQRRRAYLEGENAHFDINPPRSPMVLLPRSVAISMPESPLSAALKNIKNVWEWCTSGTSCS